MVIEAIAAGLGIIASVSTIIRNFNAPSCSYQPTRTVTPQVRTQSRAVLSQVDAMDSRVSSLERQLQQYRNSSRTLREIVKDYNKLIQIIQKNTHYSDQLQFIPTSYGTWKLVRVRKKPKSVILRDPSGEY